MKVLFLYDDIWHPWDVIERGLKSFGNRLDGYAFEFVRTAKDILTPELLKDFDVVVNAKGNQINGSNPEPWFEAGVTEVQPKDFEAFVRLGGGFLALHAGCAWWQDSVPVREPDRFTGPNRDYLDLIGASFAGHPPRCAVSVFPVGTYPITRGVSGFTGRDEQYQLTDLAPDLQVFLRSKSEAGGERIAGYTRLLGKGRLCALTPGHTLGIWQHSEFQRLLLNAIDWCGGAI